MDVSETLRPEVGNGVFRGPASSLAIPVIAAAFGRCLDGRKPDVIDWSTPDSSYRTVDSFQGIINLLLTRPAGWRDCV